MISASSIGSTLDQQPYIVALHSRGGRSAASPAEALTLAGWEMGHYHGGQIGHDGQFFFNTLPGRAPVCVPSSSTTCPLTMTVSMPTGY